MFSHEAREILRADQGVLVVTKTNQQIFIMPDELQRLGTQSGEVSGEILEVR
jgi:hypothetical protein